MNALKAFDASARLGGFTAAAQELCVSSGAVSRHVANLEEFFGEPLFQRQHNEIHLTHAGKQYFARIGPALDVIEDASSRILESSNPRQVHVVAGPGIGRDWLLPRLPTFMRDNPDVELELSTNMDQIEEVDLGLDEVDVVIHYSLSDISSEHCDFLFETELQVVCSPALANLCNEERDLCNHTLLYGLHSLTVWRQWFDLAGLPLPPRAHALKFGDASLAVEAAINGLGFALGESVCVAKDIEAGRLVSPFSHRLRTSNKFFLSVSHERADWQGVRVFREWVLQQARESRKPSAPL